MRKAIDIWTRLALVLLCTATAACPKEEVSGEPYALELTPPPAAKVGATVSRSRAPNSASLPTEKDR